MYRIVLSVDPGAGNETTTRRPNAADTSSEMLSRQLLNMFEVAHPQYVWASSLRTDRLCTYSVNYSTFT